MRKPVSFLMMALLIAGGYFLYQNFKVRGLDSLRLEPRSTANGGGAGFGRDAGEQHDAAAPPAQTRTANGPLPAGRGTEKIRIASFNIQVFGDSKMSKHHVMDVLAQVIRQFDVVAIQEVRTKSQDLLPRFVEMINANGAQYDFVIGPRLGRTNSKEQYAVIFDRKTIEVDRQQVYTVEDPDDLLHREPMVAWFRVRGPPPNEAFTFTLVDIHTDPDEVKQEVNALADVFHAVRDDGRGEDDVIVLGDLNASDKQLGRLGQIPHIYAAISGIPTNTRGTSQYDNIIFDQTVTKEFTGRAGVYDYMREYNLSMQEALEVSDHMPVWAEFSAYEGGDPGRYATRPGQPSR